MVKGVVKQVVYDSPEEEKFIKSLRNKWFMYGIAVGIIATFVTLIALSATIR